MISRETVKLVALVCGIGAALLLPDDSEQQMALPSVQTGPSGVQTLETDSIG